MIFPPLRLNNDAGKEDEGESTPISDDDRTLTPAATCWCENARACANCDANKIVQMEATAIRCLPNKGDSTRGKDAMVDGGRR